MMMAPQVVGVLLKKPGQQRHPHVPPLDPQETKIRGELYVEDLGERRVVSIRMGWLWVEGTPMRLPLRALNLRQAAPSVCQPHVLALGFTLSNSQGDTLATFWADTEPVYWSWVRAIAAELVRQTPFRAQRCLNFLEILTICPRGPVPLPDSPVETRRRSRSELRCWLRDSPCDTDRSTSILEETRRRAKSELRGWSSNSSDEDLLGDFRSIPTIRTKAEPLGRTWGCSESSEGSDDSLPWGGGQSSVDSVDSANSVNSINSIIGIPSLLSQSETREQRIQRYKEARRRENEARSKRVLEEDARNRRARAEENNNVLPARGCHSNDNQEARKRLGPTRESVTDSDRHENFRARTSDNDSSRRRPPVKPIESSVRFEDNDTNNNCNNNPVVRTDSGERRSRARERRSVREKGHSGTSLQISNSSSALETLQERKERLASSSRIPVPKQTKTRDTSCTTQLPRSPTSLSVVVEPREEDVARLLERCQRVDHYVPVRDKLTLFESLSRLGGRLARSTEDLGRSTSKPSPRGKQRARSLHDLNRGNKSLPVREMCRFFEGDLDDQDIVCNVSKTRFSDPVTPTRGPFNDSKDENFTRVSARGKYSK
ncbi:uncharacterized protein LOC107266000 [Cephus cinctus]|uniref:Uncharacterized protein LOC107266000 n=1 Tax=Cephus cinctus TaxID=211228 RepID=A0AAJ7VZJ2_CEPCN|nr:uncharacterized protein LOC107266000 [Cephus cinctus]